MTRYDLQWSLARNPDSAGEGRSIVAALVITPAPNLWVYAHQPKGTGMPTTVRFAVTRPPGAPEPEARYLPGTLKKDPAVPGGSVMVYQGATPVFTGPIGVPKGADLGLTAKVRMLLCSDTACFPVDETMEGRWTTAELAALPPAQDRPWWPAYQGLGSETLPPEAAAAQSPPPLASTTAGPSWAFEPAPHQPGLEVAGLWRAVVLGFLAGLILNVMPCVLPVVSLKLSCLLAAAGEGGKRRDRLFREHNLFFALGVLAFFLILGAVLGLAGLMWGQLFQSQGMVLGLAVVVFGLGLSLFGVWRVPLMDLGASAAGSSCGHAEASPSRVQPFLTGFLATLLATPCSGPLLGGVLGWTLFQGPATVLTVFACVGLGMASPYFLMALWSAPVRLLPRPGAWVGVMETLVGFFLMAACVYLVSILGDALRGPALVVLLVTAVAAWLAGNWGGLTHGAGRRLAVHALGLALVAGSMAWALAPPERHSPWQAYSREGFEELLGKENVVVEFTADWCPSCKVLEATVFTDGRVVEWAAAHRAVFLRADLTRQDAAGMGLLGAIGSASIPVAALFPAADPKRPVVLRDLFTAGQFQDALERAFGDKP